VADKKLLKEVEPALDGGSSDLLEWFRWAKYGQPVPQEMRPALCFVAAALGEPYGLLPLVLGLEEAIKGRQDGPGGEALE